MQKQPLTQIQQNALKAFSEALKIAEEALKLGDSRLAKSAMSTATQLTKSYPALAKSLADAIARAKANANKAPKGHTAKYKGLWYPVLQIVDNGKSLQEGGGNFYTLGGHPERVHQSEIEDYSTEPVKKSTRLWKSESNRVACLAVKADNKLLMMKRNDNKKWTFPGGHVENGEDFEKGAIREFREETGIQDLAEITDAKLRCKTPNGKVVKAFLVELEKVPQKITNENDPDKEALGFKWFSVNARLPKEILENLHVAAKHNLILKMFPKMNGEKLNKAEDAQGLTMHEIGNGYTLHHRNWTEPGERGTSKRHYWELHHENKTVGKFLVDHSEFHDKSHDGMHMSHSFIDKPHRGKGLGQKVYQKLADHYGGLASDTGKTSNAAKRVWSKLNAKDLPEPTMDGKTRKVVQGDPLKPPIVWAKDLNKAGTGLQKLRAMSNYYSVRNSHPHKKDALLGKPLHITHVPLTPADRPLGVSRSIWLEEHVNKPVKVSNKKGVTESFPDLPSAHAYIQGLQPDEFEKQGFAIASQKTRSLQCDAFLSQLKDSGIPHGEEKAETTNSRYIRFPFDHPKIRHSDHSSQKGVGGVARNSSMAKLEFGNETSVLHAAAKYASVLRSLKTAHQTTQLPEKNALLEPQPEIKKSAGQVGVAALGKGENGDWQKEGYTLSHTTSPHGGIYVNAHDKQGNHAGFASIGYHDWDNNEDAEGVPIFSKKPTDHIMSYETEVFPQHQRKGVASAMYDYAEEHFRVPLEAGSTSHDAEHLWKFRQFRQKGPSLKKSDNEVTVDWDEAREVAHAIGRRGAK